MDINTRQTLLLDIIAQHGALTRSQLLDALAKKGEAVSFMTINRDTSHLMALGYIQSEGNAKATMYSLNPSYNIVINIDPQSYFAKDINERIIHERFNFDIINELEGNIFTKREIIELADLEKTFHTNLKNLSETIQKKEFERAAIDLSWKSSALEGNTYTLLETETLIKEGIEAKGKQKEETDMILNHKKAIEYIRMHKEEFQSLQVSKIEYLHSLLVENLGITKNLRNTLVGITGTNYKPLDNVFQIQEALEHMISIVNKKKNIFEKAIITLAMVGYIQPFEDGNKRTSRLLANAVLLANDAFPISLRSLDINQYKEALLMFYEINNISFLKKLFIQQCRFAVENYFNPTL